MIISKIIGGLGNQLFQYAIARNMAQKYSEELRLDISGYKNYRRPYFLDCFNIIENPISKEESDYYSEYMKRFSVRRFIESIKPTGNRNYRKEKMHHFFDSEVLKKEPGQIVYLDGYWQNEKYFSDSKKILFKEFSLKDEFDIKDKPTYEKIANTESVSVHIRRGDDQVNKYYGACSAEYYRKCMYEISRRVKNPLFFIFVNEDIEWAKKNLKTEFPIIYVGETGGLTDPQELVAMSACKHNIIANSTFSWWAAWLNKNPDKIVYAPKRWLKKEIYKTFDFIPGEWNKIDAF